jgi:hypothetical protein
VTHAASQAPAWRRLAGALAVVAVIGAYYWLFFTPPRSMGSGDPDRYYHLALARLWAEGGLPRVLPQVEELGWGRYFPDKEFLFHVLTGGAYRLGGEAGVLWLVPLLGISLLLVLYAEMSRRIRPLHAALLATLVPLLTAAYMFRLTLLRPHLLATLAFCAVLVALLRGRPRLVAVAAAAFALSYHGVYIVGLVAAIAWLLRNQPGWRGTHGWAWCLGGLGVGLLVNPYFPSNIEMGWTTLRLALGLDHIPMAVRQQELAGYTWKKLLLAYGFVPAALLATAAMWRWRRPAWDEDAVRLAFLVAVTGAFWLLGVQTPRAMEYAMPACILMVGQAGAVFAWRGWLPLVLVLLVVPQGYVDWVHYRARWLETDTLPSYHEYSRVLAQARPAPGAKVFNCEWEAGAFILRDRPDLRFVDLLEPALLWRASPDKYLVRKGLLQGRFADPRRTLREVFAADYVLCAEPALIRQMDADRADFTSLPGTQGDMVRLFAVRPR